MTKVFLTNGNNFVIDSEHRAQLYSGGRFLQIYPIKVDKFDNITRDDSRSSWLVNVDSILAIVTRIDTDEPNELTL